MARWEPGARVRLERAAVELYGERGFTATSVAQIAERAGLTERTFFRHYADKREVLFAGATVLEEFLVGRVAGAPPAVAPLEAVADAFDAVGPAFFDDRRDAVGERQAVIVANPDLRERELVKLATLAGALAGALRERGVDEPGASLAAEAGVAVFRVAFDRWITGDGGRTLALVLRESFTELARLTAVGRS